MKASNDDQLSCEARKLLDSGQYRQALRLLGELRHDESYQVRAYCNIGAALFQLRRFKFAREFLEHALALDPHHAVSWMNLGNVLVETGHLQDADIAYQRAINIDELNPTLAATYVNVLLLTGRAAEALNLMESVIKRIPHDSLCNFYYGLALHRSGNNEAAIQSFAKAIRLGPSHHQTFLQLGKVLMTMGKVDEAVRVLEKALDLEPNHLDTLAALGTAYYVSSETILAKEIDRRALGLDSSSLQLFLNYHLITPIVANSLEDIHAYRARCIRGLIKAKQSKLRVTPHHMRAHLFHLAYHESNDRRLLEAYASILRPHFTAPSSTNKNRDRNQGQPLQASRKVRIAFISEYFYSHSNSRAFEGLIRNLNRETFEVYIVHGPNSKEDETRLRISNLADHCLTLRLGPDNAQRLASLDLDILFYTDIGMMPFMTSLALNRIAPIQMTGWGIPHTSGIKTLDFYISSELAEPPEASEHYTESLVRLPALPCCYLSEQLELYDLPRDYFMLPSDVPIFGCLQSLFKLHPDFDFALEEIALQNPEAGFVFVESPVGSLTAKFLSRLKRSAPTVCERIIFLAIMGREQFISLSNCMDVLLDPFYYGSGITFYESSFTGTPTVTMEGGFLRSRFVSAAYRYIGLTNPPIAKTPEEYVNIASELIQNKSKLLEMKEELRQKASAKLYDDMSYVKSFEDFCMKEVRNTINALGSS